MKLNALEIMKDMMENYEKVVVRWAELYEGLSICDKKRNDLEHVMEFYNFNAAENSKLTTMMKNVLRERREIKNEMEELRPLKEGKLNVRSDATYKKIETIVAAHANENEDRKYKVRILKELFGDVLTSETKPQL